MGKKNKQINNNNNKKNGAKNDQSEASNQGDEEKKTETSEENEENKKDKNNNNSCKEVVLKVYMHCDGCANKVSNCLKCFPGVVEIETDRENNKVTVKGKKLDPIKVLERVQKKFSKNSELISPKPKQGAKNTEKKEQEKKKEPQVKTLVLKMLMHCEGCAHDIKKNLQKMTGVLIVEADMETSRVIVKGVFEPPMVVEFIKKRLGKHVEILKQENAGKGKGNKDGDGDGNENEKKGNQKEKEKKKKDDANTYNYPPIYYSTQYIYPCQTFSDENVHACSIM